MTEASVHTYRVPGAFELPYAAKLCADTGRFAGVACLGVVIRGETDHYDFVCSEAASGIQRVQLDTGVPCAFGVITCDTRWSRRRRRRRQAPTRPAAEAVSAIGSDARRPRFRTAPSVKA